MIIQFGGRRQGKTEQLRREGFLPPTVGSHLRIRLPKDYEVKEMPGEFHMYPPVTLNPWMEYLDQLPSPSWWDRNIVCRLDRVRDAWLVLIGRREAV